MKSLRIAAILLLIAGPVCAQGLSTSILPDTASKSPEQLEREQAIERNYKESLKKIPDGKASNDPWSNVRGAETQRNSAKTLDKTSATGISATGTSAAKTAPAKNSQTKNSQQ